MSIFNWFAKSHPLDEFRPQEQALRKLRFKIGEVGSQIAIDQEKGMEVSDERKQEYLELQEQLINELQEYAELLHGRLQLAMGKDAEAVNSRLGEIQKQIITIQNTTGFFS